MTERLDYLALESDLEGEEKQVLETAREFIEEKIKPNIGEHFIDGTRPEGIIKEMGELGFYAPNLEGYGCAGLSETAYGVLMQELEAGDSGIRSNASVQGSLVMYPIHRYGSEEQKKRYLPGMANGEIVGCFGLTEPKYGSEPSGMETTAVKDGDRYLLNGEKTWITNSPVADIGLIWAREEASGDVKGFLLPMDNEGVETQEIDGKLSLRTSIVGRIDMNDAVVPDENILPGVEGMRGPLSCLTNARFGIAWGAVGAARDAYMDGLNYAMDREQWGRPIAGFQLQQEKIAESATAITNSQLLAYRLAELKERDELSPEQVSMAKRNNVAMAREVARTAREMIGGNGITADYSPMRHLMNIETVYTYEGTHDIHTLILGSDITGYQAFRG